MTKTVPLLIAIQNDYFDQCLMTLEDSDTSFIALPPRRIRGKPQGGRIVQNRIPLSSMDRLDNNWRDIPGQIRNRYRLPMMLRAATVASGAAWETKPSGVHSDNDPATWIAPKGMPSRRVTATPIATSPCTNSSTTTA